MPSSDLPDDLFHSRVQGIGRPSVPPHARTRRHQGSIRLKSREFLYPIIWCLRQTDHSTQRQNLVLVAWSLSAPRTTIHIHSPINDTDDWIVIVQKPGALNVFKSQWAVSALSRAASAKEHVSCPFISDHRCMNHQSVIRRGVESV